ncbi:MAG: hypothetical protein ABWX74_15665 [Aeromicrobium sp.]
MIVLGAVATGTSPGAALVVGGIVLALATPLFLVRAPVPAGRQAAPMLDDDGIRGARGCAPGGHRE